MPRQSRIIIPEVPVNIIQRTKDSQPCFYNGCDYSFYLKCLQKYAQDAGCLLHAYVLMDSHIHLLLTPMQQTSVASLMKRLAQRYTIYLNRNYFGYGSLWEGRYRSCITQQDKFFLDSHRYIEITPINAGNVGHPIEYPWSSYRANAHGINSSLLTPHSMYLKLGKTDEERQDAYRSLFQQDLSHEIIEMVGKAAMGNYVLGEGKFIAKVEKLAGRRLSPGKAGRPRKTNPLRAKNHRLI